MTSQLYFSIAILVIVLITAFKPGQSPPPDNSAIFLTFEFMIFPPYVNPTLYYKLNC